MEEDPGRHSHTWKRRTRKGNFHWGSLKKRKIHLKKAERRPKEAGKGKIQRKTYFIFSILSTWAVSNVTAFFIWKMKVFFHLRLLHPFVPRPHSAATSFPCFNLPWYSFCRHCGSFFHPSPWSLKSSTWDRSVNYTESTESRLSSSSMEISHLFLGYCRHVSKELTGDGTQEIHIFIIFSFFPRKNAS